MVCVWAVKAHRHYIYRSDANYLLTPFGLVVASPRFGLVMFLPPHHISDIIPTELCFGLWVLLL